MIQNGERILDSGDFYFVPREEEGTKGAKLFCGAWWTAQVCYRHGGR